MDNRYYVEEDPNPRYRSSLLSHAYIGDDGLVNFGYVTYGSGAYSRSEYPEIIPLQYETSSPKEIPLPKKDIVEVDEEGTVTIEGTKQMEKKLNESREVLVKHLNHFVDVLDLEDSVIIVSSTSGKKTVRLDRSMNPFVSGMLTKYREALDSGDGMENAINRTIPFWKRVKYWWGGSSFP